MVGTAVKVIGVPKHTLLTEAAMLTFGVTAVVTVMITPAEVAVAGDAQGSEEVMVQVTTSPLFNDELLKVELFDPTPVPFTIH